MTEKDLCKTCHWFYEFPPEAQWPDDMPGGACGHCHRYPQTVAHRQTIHADDYCGEHKQKNE